LEGVQPTMLVFRVAAYVATMALKSDGLVAA
jgi:hypothetical protein